MKRKRLVLVAGAILLGATVMTGVWIARITTATAEPKPWLVATLRAEAEAIPLADRAWPIYRSTIAQLREGRSDTYDYEPSNHEEWPTYREWLRGQRDEVDAIIAATSLPHLGLPWGTPELWSVGEKPSADPMADSAADQSFEPCGLIRNCYRLLRSDAYLALEDGDVDRALRSLRACIQLIAQCDRSKGSLIQQLVTTACLSGAFRVVDAFTRDPRLHTTDRLDQLDAILAEMPTGVLRFAEDLPFELEVLDLLFAPNGWGGGRLTSDAIEASRQAGAMLPQLGMPGPGNNATLDTPSLVVQLLGPTRDQAEAKLRELSSALQALAAVPEHKRPELSAALPEPLFLESAVAPLDALRNATSLLRIGDLTTLDRDAHRLAVAILRHRAAQGEWPDSSSHASTPDPFTGSHVRWLVRNGELLVYSLGYDGIDNSGVEPAMDAGEDRPFDWRAYFGQEEYSSRTGDVVVVRVPVTGR